MRKHETEVLVVGGGATGTGVLRDLAMRGFDATLVEQRDLTHGTTGRFHGLLHSGGRYVVKDPEAAVECIEENRVLRRIMPHCIEDTSGFFVVTPWDDEDFIPDFLAGCRAAGIPTAEIPVAEALRREPLLNPGISHCFEVPDASADAFLATQATVESARQHGATAFPYHEVRTLIRSGDRVVGARCRDLVGGEDVVITADLVINATGAWAGRIAASVGIDFVVQAGKGTMVAINHRMLNTVVNRCKMPADGDIIVPIRTVAVIGTTDEGVPDPERFSVEPWEVQLMLEEGEKLVPGISGMRVLRAWAGVRPLYQEEAAEDTRDVTRAYALLDHAARDGVEGFLTITGGKWGTFRQMAEVTVDSACRKLGVDRACRTHLEELPDRRNREGYHWLGERLARIEKEEDYGDLVCECELATRADVVRAIHEGDARTIDDVRRDVRLGMGPCQGGWCLPRVAGLLHEVRRSPVVDANVALREFLQERWKGLLPVVWGRQLHQARLDDLIFRSLLHVGALPGPASSPLGPVMYERPTDETTVEAAPTRTPHHATEPVVAGVDRDVVVVGGGLGGLSAAWHATLAGASTVVVTKGLGSLIWHTGCVDVLGYLAGFDEPVESPAAALDRLPADHPYAIVGRDALSRAIAGFRTLTEDGGYPLEGSLESNHLLPTALGAARPTCLAPSTMTAGDLRRRDPMLIVGLEGFSDLYPRMVAHNLNALGIPARGVSIDVPTVRRRRFVTATILASFFEREAFRSEVIDALARTGENASRIGFPAVLGLDRAPEVVADLSQRLGAEVFEIPTLPPSVPGIRLQNILRRAIGARGGKVLDNVEAVGIDAAGQSGISVITEAAARRQRFRGHSVVLATGGILGGGIFGSSDGRLSETVAGIEVSDVGSRLDWFGRRVGEYHPVFQAGVETSSDLRPRAGSPHPNVFVAGGLLAGADPIREGSLEGIALATGYAAGAAAASVATSRVAS
ncbi:MAG TPA: anaerobic glycerol-3-phosphate dehydrogenase subunit GlpA [Acidimicrobiia bacterium]|nr:anaerobic glycerol-3-phosphate dehydrogenase subunit GlpA [Acidimicrobiia bacterium]